MDQRQKSTYEAIVARCTDLTPPVDIARHIKPGTLRIANNTLDGITFKPVDAEDLSAEFSGRKKLPGADKMPKPGTGPLDFDTTRAPRPADASMIGMKEDPQHWALKASFGATVGDGYRELWKAPPTPKGLRLPTPSYADPRLSLGFGETGKRLSFTALHAAVAPDLCNVHIDERGFVVDTPMGAVVTPTFWGHIANELLLKTKFRDWLDGLIGDKALGGIVVEAVNRVSLRFPDAENGFAGLEEKVNKINGINDLKGIGKTLLPIGASADLIHFRNSTVQANYYWYGGQQTLTISWGGTFEKFGSK